MFNCANRANIFVLSLTFDTLHPPSRLTKEPFPFTRNEKHLVSLRPLQFINDSILHCRKVALTA